MNSAPQTGVIQESSDGRLDRNVAPVRSQYLQIKRRFPDTILFFRLGDFYETFEADAELAAATLDITLTSRDLGKGVRVPMAGIPHHAAEAYVARLVNAGHKVAICDQVGAVSRGRGLIEREVTRVVTPGTVTDPAMLDGRRNCYIAAIILDGKRVGIAYSDLSTGEFAATQLALASQEAAAEAAVREIVRLGATEIVVPDSDAYPIEIPANLTRSTVPRWLWTFDEARSRLMTHFGVDSLDGFGLADQRTATQAAGGILAYLEQTQRARVAQLTSLHTYSVDGTVVLDALTRRNLELLEGPRGERRHGLVSVLDETRSPLGARRLRSWLSQPLLDLEEIRLRQDAIQFYVNDGLARAQARQLVGKIGDIERVVNRAITGAVTPRELASLRQSLSAVIELGGAACRPPGFDLSPSALNRSRDVHDLLCRALQEEPPPSIGSGAAIKPGFSPELDSHERNVREAREWIAGLERQERERTGIRSLKVAYNRASGYYIEISATALQAAERSNGHGADGSGPLPGEYVIRQSLANCSRFVTAELKEHEARVLGAQETLAQLEQDVFRRVACAVADQVELLREAADAVARIDVVATLAEVAALRNYVRPVVDDSFEIEIVGGRHPTLETLLPAGEFVANDARLDGDQHRITILTGPNMAGKSSWLRQVGLIVVLAQIGSFVPAASARIGLVDRIFTRIGAQDDIAAGQSTFMVEMLETANILHHATPRSLVLLDEIGRGTSTWDGLAIARAVVEHIHNAPRLGCRTLFATHFHELTALADLLPGVCCARMDVLEDGDQVVFLHHVVPGATDKSYGIHVAELAGVPRALTRRARDILADLEKGAAGNVHQRRRRVAARAAPEDLTLQLTLFSPPSQLLQAVRAIDVESLSPLEALTKLYELRQLAEQESSPDV